MPQRVHVCLEALAAAERARDALPEGTPAWQASEALVMQAKEHYLASVRELADRMGSAGMADIPQERSFESSPGESAGRRARD
jgi:hypothetical protein